MSKCKSDDISRRSFLGVTIGTAVVAGVGCSSNDSESQPSGAGGQLGTTSNSTGGAAPGNGGAAPGNGGAGGGTSNASGGSSTAANGGSGTAAGGSSSATTGRSGGTSAANGGSSSAKGGATNGAAGKSGSAVGGESPGGATGKGGATSGGGKTGTSTGGSNTAGASSSVPTGSKLVAMVRNTDLVKATKDAIAGAGGLPNLAGKTVFLKPNLLAATASPCTPNPEVIRAVIQAVKAAGATKILIGDSPASGNATTVMGNTNVGIHAVVQAEGGVTEVNLSTTTVVSPAGAAKWANGINIYKELLDDGAGAKPYVINICCCKHHGSAVWSLAMKNWYGIVPSGDRKHVSSGTANQAQIPEIHLAVKEDFVILDASKSYITQGPSSGTVASPGIVVATADAVAAEATGLAILRHYRAAGGVAKDDIENVKIFSTDTKTLMGRALTLGNGWISSRDQYTYSAVGLGADEASIIAQLDT